MFSGPVGSSTRTILQLEGHLLEDRASKADIVIKSTEASDTFGAGLGTVALFQLMRILTPTRVLYVGEGM